MKAPLGDSERNYISWDPRFGSGEWSDPLNIWTAQASVAVLFALC